MGIFGLVCLLLGGATFVSAVRSSGWPTVPGKVLESHVRLNSHDEENRPPSFTYSLDVVYSYRVEGVEYRGTRLRFSGSPAYREGAEALKALRSYAVGATVQVHFDPALSGDSSLDAQIGSSWFLPVFGLVLLGGAITMGRRPPT